LVISAAIGISYYTPGTDTSVEDVFKRADQNMYENTFYTTKAVNIYFHYYHSFILRFASTYPFYSSGLWLKP